jgi:Cytochrome C biogenesis protein transmembrane region
MPKSFGHFIYDLAERDANGGAFALGAATFFLPCGFTQALQLYVLAKGSFAIGALSMFAFSLGTLPALLSLSAMSSFATGSLQRHFLNFAGASATPCWFAPAKKFRLTAFCRKAPRASMSPCSLVRACPLQKQKAMKSSALLKNFLDIAATWNAQRGPRAAPARTPSTLHLAT